MKSKIIGIIPARGGSKGVPGKNAKELAGKPLIAYTIEAALASKYLDQVFVSTDDIEISNISEKYKANVIKRPSELAKDNSPTIDAIFHAIDTIQNQNIEVGMVVLLQPTSPLRTTFDIDKAIELFSEKKCESLVSVCEAEHPPFWYSQIEAGYLKPLMNEKYLKMRRQDLPRTYLPNGAIYISIPSTLKKFNGFYCSKTIPYIMPLQRSIDIDNEIDFMTVETILYEKKYI
ncbi:cytidylyltransferase domain-containing protein [Methanolobus bombayensis]|uniref:acylneuraminate cytidylyltransferase family protein n=1 Tax=Methanolobus bombayensis TaxID=38023 RepID=UPI001AE3EA33|nr:acylneuraminate cytidylyltransferase family protein [Methanolobus bombayensis]MBP1908189.1 N-acylneuraminate cytidylyltransferase [Methanolobus bombayensis]